MNTRALLAAILIAAIATSAGADAPILRTTSVPWDAGREGARHVFAWRQGETVEIEYSPLHTNNVPLDLSATNIVVRWDVVSATNIYRTWISKAAEVRDPTGGVVAMTLDQEESILEPGQYYGFVRILTMDGTNVARRSVAVVQALTCRYAPDERYTTYSGPLTYEIPGASNYLLVSLLGDGFLWDGTNWLAGVSTNTIDLTARAWISAVSNKTDEAADTGSIAYAWAAAAYSLAFGAATSLSGQVAIAQATGSTAMARANQAHDLAATMTTQGHKHVVADVIDFPISWSWANLTSLPDSLVGYGITDTWNRVQADARYLQDAPSNGTKYVRIDGSWIEAGNEMDYSAVQGASNIAWAAWSNAIGVGQSLSNLTATVITQTLNIGVGNVITQRTQIGQVQYLYWGTISGGGMDPAIASNSFVAKTGGAMTGPLTVGTISNLARADFTNEVAIGRDAIAVASGVAVGNLANGAGYGVSIGSSSRGDNYGVAVGWGASVGGRANGVAVGRSAACTHDRAVAVGQSAVAYADAVAIGVSANAYQYGVAIGRLANANTEGVAIGARNTAGSAADAGAYGVALGPYSKGMWFGVAVGHSSTGTNYGVGIGYAADGSETNIAIGARAIANRGSYRTAIGVGVSNTVDNSAFVRGSAYLDGGTQVFARAAFGTGAFAPISVPLITNNHPGVKARLVSDSGATAYWLAE